MGSIVILLFLNLPNATMPAILKIFVTIFCLILTFVSFGTTSNPKSLQLDEIMQILYNEVEIAISEKNSPFAAIITDSNNNIIVKTHNKSNTKNLAIAHAEIEAIQEASRILGKKRLEGYNIYVNAESCAMCAGAIIKSGISKVFYGAPHEIGSNPEIYLEEINERANPKLIIQSGIWANQFWEQIKRGRQLRPFDAS